MSYNDVSSKALPIVWGIPQGSNIGPLLFLIYIDDIQHCSKKLKFLLFADDTNIFLSGRDLSVLISNLNSELISLSNWFDANKLSVNIKKSNNVIFGGWKNIKDPTVLVLHNGVILDRVFNNKFLGVVIDDKLNWKVHIKQVLIKITRHAAILSKNSLQSSFSHND